MAKSGTIVTVCTANICRSPMAEALLRHALRAEPEPLKSMKVVSAGVSARQGDRVSENSVVALRKVGLDVRHHKSQPLTRKVLDEATIILCMTESHRTLIQLTFDPPPSNVYLFREFMPGAVAKEICDPYGGPLSEYEACRDEMVEAIPSLMTFIKDLAEKK